MNKAKMSGAVLATVVGLMFAAGPVLAQDSSSQANVKCIGGNSCKGQNSCKGKGWVTAASAQDCTNKGGHVESN